MGSESPEPVSSVQCPTLHSLISSKKWYKKYNYLGQSVNAVHSDGIYAVCLSHTSSLSFVGFSLHVFWERRLLAHNTLSQQCHDFFFAVLSGLELNSFTVWGYVNTVDNSGMSLLLLINAKAFYTSPTAPAVSRLGIHGELGGEIARTADPN